MAFLCTAGFLEPGCRLARWSDLAFLAGQIRWSASGWQVSSHGQLKSPTGLISWGSLKCSGYCRACLEGQYYYVHRLVAASFLGPPPTAACWQVHHIDSDRSNNLFSNLRYVTQAENTRESWATNTTRSSNPDRLCTSVLWKACGDVSWTWCASQSKAAQSLGVCRSCISRAVRGFVAKCYGHTAWYEFRRAHSKELQPFADETWQIGRYPGIHEDIPNLMVSNHGRVWSSCRSRSVTWCGYRNEGGYCVVRKGKKALYVHRLVAATFFGQPHSPDLQVNHKDRNRGNNHVDNLEYVTQSQNMKHAYAHIPGQPRLGTPVKARMLSPGSPWLLFPSYRAAAAYTSISRKTIPRICRGTSARPEHTDWEFRFAEQGVLPGEEWRPLVLEGARAPKHVHEAA